jgi:hypothetical protein
MKQNSIDTGLTIHVPGLQKEIGAGDIVAKVTAALSIKPCTPCQKRREQLNRALKLTPK